MVLICLFGGRLPDNLIELPLGFSDIRIKHYGWATQADRIAKYNRYMKLDPLGQYGWKAQYDSILDPNPRLIQWIE